MSPTSAKTGRPAYDPRRLREIFDRRAATFDDVAFLPREIAQRMRERLDYIKVAPARVLDAGCGTGADLPGLRERFADASVLGVDLSQAMLAARTGRERRRRSRRRLAAVSARHARQGFRRARSALRPGRFLCACRLWPARSNAVVEPRAALALAARSRVSEWQRVLKVNGLLMFSTFGPDTLKELSGAYRKRKRRSGCASARPHDRIRRHARSRRHAGGKRL